MSCGELFVNLGGGGSTPPNGMLQTTAALSSSLQVVKDNLGNSSSLALTTNYARFGISGSWFITLNNSISHSAGIPLNITSDSGAITLGSGTITSNGLLTIKGDGGNIASFRNSSNVEVSGALSTGILFSDGISIGQTNVNLKGIVQSGAQIQVNYVNSGGVRFSNSSSGFKTLIVGEYSEDMISMGGITSSFPALKRSSAILQTKLADDSDFAVHEVLSILTQKPTNSNAKKIKFGDKSAITDGALVALGFDAQWEVEINGSSYWFAGKTSAFA